MARQTEPIRVARRWVLQRLARAHSAQLIRTKARTRRPSRHGYTFVVLETLGARTGARRQVTLLYLQDGDDFIVLASNFGQERPPAWYFNLVAQPDASVLHDGHRIPVRAENIDGDERASLIPRMTKYNAQWKRYFGTVERDLPIVRLSPR
jgi:deazaflavin-dependent oxidoreductase (nitroreductase family)